jgi:hypothetical protein
MAISNVYMPSDAPMPHKLSTIGVEAGATGSGGTYLIQVTFKPHKLDVERKRALAIVMRQKTRELATLVGMIIEGATVNLNVTGTDYGVRMCDLHEALDDEEV